MVPKHKQISKNTYNNSKIVQGRNLGNRQQEQRLDPKILTQEYKHRHYHSTYYKPRIVHRWIELRCWLCDYNLLFALKVEDQTACDDYPQHEVLNGKKRVQLLF